VGVLQDTRLNYQAMELRIATNNAIFPIQFEVEKVSICPFFYSMLSFMSQGILLYQLAYCVMASTMLLVIVIQRSGHC
jgi:hypothetical protein